MEDRKVLDTTLDVEGFWQIIDKARENGRTEHELYLNTIDLLSKWDAERILGFGLLFAHYQQLADTPLMRAAAGIMEDRQELSKDSFPHFCSFLICQGRGVYEDARQDPDALAKLGYQFHVIWNKMSGAVRDAYGRTARRGDFWEQLDRHRLPDAVMKEAEAIRPASPPPGGKRRGGRALPSLTRVYTGPYEAADGASIRWSELRYRHGDAGDSRMLFGGHQSLEDLTVNESFCGMFLRDIRLDTLHVQVKHFVTGTGEAVRNMNEDEICLAYRREMHGVRVGGYACNVTRTQTPLPPPSPLTEREMSLFFTAVSERAESLGFTPQLNEEWECLDVVIEGQTAAHIYENGICNICTIGLNHAYTGGLTALHQEVPELRASIPQHLYPHDYGIMRGWMAAGMDVPQLQS